MTAKTLSYLKWGFVLLFFHISIGRWNLLPDFLGIILILVGIRSQKMTETEVRIQPLLVVLAIDNFLHWFLIFDHELEELLITIISTYAIYILLGEIAGRIRESQASLSSRLHHVRIAYASLQVLSYLFGAYDNEVLVMLLAAGFIILLVVLLAALFGIKPMEE